MEGDPLERKRSVDDEGFRVPQKRPRPFAQLELGIESLKKFLPPEQYALICSEMAELKEQMKTILYDKLPPINTIGYGSTSGPSESHTHGEASLVVKPFGLSQIPYETTQHLDIIWATALGKTDYVLEYSTENSIQTYVAEVLRDVIRTAGLDNYIETQQELAVGKDKPDVWLVIKLNGVPIGVVEVKKPGRLIMESGKLSGQIFDYMVCLRSLYGIRHVFGIVTTYEEWRVVWLPDTDERAAEQVDVPQRKEKTPSEVIETSTDPRIIHGTEILKYDDDKLVQTLCTAVWKMYLSPARRPERIQEERTYMVMDENGWTWQKPFLRDAPSLNLDSYPKALLERTRGPASFNKIILLEELHGGSNGRVWLACAPNGQSCVIKFLLHGTNEDLETEAKNWNDDGIAQVKTIILNKKPALIMPYYKPCDQPDDRPDEEEIKTAIRKFAESGFLHNDLHWRHVARKSKDEIIFIDRGNIKRINPKDQKEVQSAIDKMEQSLGL